MNDTLNISQDWTDNDWDKFSEWLTGMLHTGPATVTFTKKDGTERVMNCTLDPKQLPPQVVVEDKKERKKSDTTIAVFDLEAKAWRSFTIKSVKRVNIQI
jgi:hypothetical protein